MLNSVVGSSGAGSVVGYNYMDNGYIFTTPDWVEVGLNGSHMVGGHHVLFEGNESFNYDSDNTHGNAIAMTVFRNHLTGRRLIQCRSESVDHALLLSVLHGKILDLLSQSLSSIPEGRYGDGIRCTLNRSRGFRSARMS